MIHLYFGSDELQGSPLQVRVSDPHKAWLSGPDQGTVGSMVAFKGSMGYRRNIIFLLRIILQHTC